MEQNKMTPAKDWKIVRSNPLSNGTGYCIDLEIEGTNTHLDFWVHGNMVESEAKAKLYVHSIVTAVDSTFGAGINPEAVVGLLTATVELVSALDNLRQDDLTDAAKTRVSRYLREAKAAIEKATIK